MNMPLKFGTIASRGMKNKILKSLCKEPNSIKRLSVLMQVKERTISKYINTMLEDGDVCISCKRFEPRPSGYLYRVPVYATTKEAKWENYC